MTTSAGSGGQSNGEALSPLTGITILDFTMFQHGPYGTMLLAEMGADVIKVEPPGGEFGRASGSDSQSFSAFFEGNNRGKRSITLDLKNPDAIRIVEKLLPGVDVVVENYRPGVMERLGLGYDALRALKPDLIYASASAWGPDGPWASRGGYDHVAQALSGVMYEQGSGPNGTPHALVAGFADAIGGIFLAYGVSTAIVARERFGIGQRVDTSLLGSMIALQSRQVVEFLRTGKQRGFEDVRAATYTHYPCADGKFVAIAANTQEMWVRLCTALDAAWLADDARFASPWGRAENKAALVAEFAQLFGGRPRDEWLERLAAHDVPHAPVLDYAGMAVHPQVWANDYIVEVETAHLGTMRVPGPAIHMSQTPPRVRGVGPILGFDTEAILLSLGFSWDDIEMLQTSGATRLV